MDMKKYLTESARTAADVELDKEEFKTNKQILTEMTCLDTATVLADALKRSLFYSQPIQDRVSKANDESFERYNKLVKKPDDVEFQFSNELLHGALGITGEAGEITQELVNASVEGREINVVNIKEELGDILWYIAMMARDLGLSFEEIAEANIKKLSVRYPDKFTKESATKRDLEKEEQALTS
jgi:NTP pyrophosphatase (non-canonical NTP hydrolase)